MKVIAFEEHYKIPAEANKANPIEQIYERWQKLGRFPGDPSQGLPPGIYDIVPLDYVFLGLILDTLRSVANRSN
jgi:hypothetical protein